MSNRKLQLISNKISTLLIEQLAHELKNYSLYKSFSNYFSVEGISKLEEYYDLRAKEEMLHHDWIFKYLSEADCKFMYPATEKNIEEITNYIDPFVQTITREILTTQMIYSIYEQALLEKDFMTSSWLYEQLIKEQIEEENTSRMARTIMEEDSSIFVRAKEVLNLLKK